LTEDESLHFGKSSRLGRKIYEKICGGVKNLRGRAYSEVKGAVSGLVKKESKGLGATYVKPSKPIRVPPTRPA